MDYDQNYDVRVILLIFQCFFLSAHGRPWVAWSSGTLGSLRATGLIVILRWTRKLYFLSQKVGNSPIYIAPSQYEVSPHFLLLLHHFHWSKISMGRIVTISHLLFLFNQTVKQFFLKPRSISGWRFAALPILWLHHQRLLQCPCRIPCCWANHHQLLQQQQQQPLQQEQQRSDLQRAWNSSANFCHQYSNNDQQQRKGERKRLRPVLPKLQRLWKKGISSAKVS